MGFCCLEICVSWHSRTRPAPYKNPPVKLSRYCRHKANGKRERKKHYFVFSPLFFFGFTILQRYSSNEAVFLYSHFSPFVCFFVFLSLFDESTLLFVWIMFFSQNTSSSFEYITFVSYFTLLSISLHIKSISTKKILTKIKTDGTSNLPHCFFLQTNS